MRLGQKQAQRLSDHFRFAVAEHALGRRVERFDRPLGANADHAVDDVVERRGKQRLGAAALRQVADDAGKSQQLVGPLAQRDRRHVRPKTGAALSHPPPLNLGAASLGLLEVALRLAVVRLLGNVEQRERAANDLVGPVAHDRLAAGAPRRDAANGVEHEKRVLGRAFDEQSKPRLAQPQSLLGLLLPAEIDHRSDENLRVVGRHRQVHQYGHAGTVATYHFLFVRPAGALGARASRSTISSSD